MKNVKYVGRRIRNVLDFLNEFPLTEDVRYFERLGGNRLKVVTNKDVYEYEVEDMKKFVESVNDTDYSIF